MLRNVLSLSLLLASWPGRVAGGDISVVAGEPALIAMLRDAMHAKETEFPHGEMQVTAEFGYDNQGHFQRKIEALVRWDGDDCYEIGTVTDYMENRELEGLPFEVSYNKTRRIYHNPNSRSMHLTKVEEGKYPMLTRLRPDEWWYGNTDGEGMTWMTLLDRISQMPTESLRHYRVTRLAGDHVELSRDGKGEGPGPSRTVFDLSQGANVLHNEYHDLTYGSRTQSDYTWGHAEGGGWYPKTADVRFSFPAGPKSPAGSHYHRYEVLAINPTVRPARAFFADAMIRPKPGTVVTNDITGQKYRIGDREPEDVIKKLDDLVGKAKSRGFGARP